MNPKKPSRGRNYWIYYETFRISAPANKPRTRPGYSIKPFFPPKKSPHPPVQPTALIHPGHTFRAINLTTIHSRSSLFIHTTRLVLLHCISFAVPFYYFRFFRAIYRTPFLPPIISRPRVVKQRNDENILEL